MGMIAIQSASDAVAISLIEADQKVIERLYIWLISLK